MSMSGKAFKKSQEFKPPYPDTTKDPIRHVPSEDSTARRGKDISGVVDRNSEGSHGGLSDRIRN